MKKYMDEKYTYEQYEAIQKHRSDRKWGTQNFNADILFSMLDKVIDDIFETKTVVCMGIRKGNEYSSIKDYKKFRNLPEIYGVDINPKVTGVGDNCFCFDFSKLPKEWGDKFDLLYSNSLDHSFDVNDTLKEWSRVVRKGGYLLLDLSVGIGVDKSDIYSFSMNDIAGLFEDIEGLSLINTWQEKGQTNRFTVFVKVDK